MPDIVEQPCDCPNCTGDTADPERMLTEIVDNAVSLAEVDDPLDAELAGALFVAMAQTGGDDAADAFAGAFVPALEARSSRAALTLLTAINSMAADEPSPVTVAAGEAAGRLAEAGVAAPVWAAELTQPLTAGPLTKLYDAEVLLDEDGPGYAPLTVLTRSRLATLPPARRPRGAPASPHVAGSN